MANEEHLKILHHGVNTWNEWRHGIWAGRHVDLSCADLAGASLDYADFNYANLSGANLSDVNLNFSNMARANLSGALLDEAHLTFASLRNANLSYANLYHCDLRDADLRAADFSGANLTRAVLHYTYFYATIVDGANFTNAAFANTSLSAVDLSSVLGLEKVKHLSPSSIGLDTIYLSGGQITESFLRGCGVPDTFITYMKSLVINPIEYNSCFISYSHKDEEFAKRLYSGLRDKNLRVWYAPEDMKRGQKIHEQIESAIQVHDRLLLLLSEHSMSSEWVKTEIYKARQREIKQKRRILFPVALVPFEQVKAWEFFDGDTGKDLAREIREYYIPDFSNWKNHAGFEREFALLLRDLKAAAP